MSAKFNYNIVALIELVEARPCLWDKNCEMYKDKNLKKNMWKDIFICLQPDFQTRATKEQEKLGKIITNKWHNIRDAFIRSLRKKSGKAKGKRYIYHEQLQFLMKDVEKAATKSSIVEESDDEVEDMKDSQPSPNIGPGFNTQHTVGRQNKRKADELETEILKVLNKKSQFPDEDTSFFYSVLPSVRSMTEDEKIEFRMGVLRLIKDIKQSRELQPVKGTPMRNPCT